MKWRTENVVALCKDILDKDDYEAMPILADALEEAGYDDASALRKLRETPSWRYQHAKRRVVNMVYSDETAAAVKWIDDLAEQMDITYNSLIRAAETWVQYEEYTTQMDNESWRDNFNVQFWEHYEVVEGKKVKDHSAQPFSCSC